MQHKLTITQGFCDKQQHETFDNDDSTS